MYLSGADQFESWCQLLRAGGDVHMFGRQFIYPVY